jgi:hypothetical protein
MASPFTKFRKYQKHGLALLAILCMISFIFSDFSCYLGGEYRDDTVAVSRYGTISEVNLTTLLQSRKAANQCVQFLIGYDGYFGPYDEEDVVRTHLLAKKAQELGIVVSDEAIHEFIDGMLFVADAKTRAEMKERAMSESGYHPTALFAALRTELAAQQVKDQLSPPLAFMHVKGRQYFMSPGERWEYYQRLHRRVTIEALAVPAADFFAAVPDPTEEELKDYFQRYKHRYAEPDSPEPGFKLAHLAAFEHFVADYDAFLEQAKAALSPADVEKYYNDNLRLFPYTGLPAGPDGKAPESDPTVDLPTFDPRLPQGPHPFFSRSPLATGTTGDAPGSAFGPEREEDKGDKSDRPFPFGSPEGTKDNSTAPPATTPPADKPPASKDGTATNPENSAENDDRSDCNPAQNDGAQKSDNTATGQKGGPAAGQPDKSSNDKSTPATAGQDTTTPGAAAADDKKDDLPSLKVILAQYRVPRSVAGGADPEYAPFWSVENEARDAAARQRALKLIDEALAPIQKVMEEYQEKHQRFEAGIDQAEPPRPDLSKLSPAGVKFHAATPMVRYRELAEEYELGELYQLDERSFQPKALRDMAYRELGLFQPAVVQSFETQDRYLVWKIKERRASTPQEMTEEYVPGGPAVREMVLRAWKLARARPKALERAAQLAQEARQSGKPLTQMSVGTRSGAKLSPFTWMSENGQISKVEGLDVPGDELMRAIYQLNEGEVAAAMNAPQTVAYVVRLVKFDYVDRGVELSESLIQTFFLSMNPGDLRDVVLHERRRQEDLWFKTIEAEAELKWIREPQLADND